MSLDADERISASLRHEILTVLAAPAHTSYALPRLSSFCGHFIHHSGWFPDYLVRLFRQDAGRFSAQRVHEKVVVAGPSPRLKNPIIHYSYVDDDAYLRKLAQYSSLGAEQAFAAGQRGGLGTALGHACGAFLRSWVFKRGFLDGQAGLMVAISSAESTYHKYFKLMLLTRAEQRPTASVEPAP